jgi:tape measure domain-containing protein
MAMNMDALLRIQADVQGENNIRRLGNSIQGLQGRAKNLNLAMDGLRGSIGGLVGLVGGGVILTKIFGDTATLESQAKSLQVLTGTAQQASQIIRELQAYGSATPFEATELIETAKRLNAFGVESVRVVEVVKNLGDVAGATGANLTELATAYGQVVAKGRLQGEELLQFQERGVALSAELQQMYKLQGQEFTKALEGGRISAEAVELAIERLTDAGGKYADGAIAQSDTLNGKFSTLKDNITVLSQTLGNILAPAMKAILDYAINILDKINLAIKTAINGPQEAETRAAIKAGKLPFGGPEALDRIIGEARRRQLQQQAGPGFLGFGFDTQNFINLLQQQPEFQETDRPTRTTPRPIPALLPGRASDPEAEARRRASEAKRAASEQERLLERRADLTQKAISLQEQLQRSLEDVNAAYKGVGATPTNQLLLERDAAIIENNRKVKELTLNVVELAREVNKAGGLLDGKPFEDLVNQLSQANVDLANQNYLQGLKDLLPSVAEYDAKIAEVARGKTELTELEKLNAEVNLLQLDILAQTNPALAEHVRLLRERAAALDAATEKQKKDSESIGEGIKQRLQDYYNSVKDLGGAIGDAVVSGLQGLEDQLTAFVTTGKANFKELAASILNDLARIAIRAAIIAPIVKALGGIFPNFKFANGGIMTGDGPVPLKKYAKGGIANSPQLALYGEGSKPEAYVPLPDGRRIPVAMQNGSGGSTSVVVNVDAKGTSVQGDAGQGEQLGRVISQAVQAELIKQKRPGGLLTA